MASTDPSRDTRKPTLRVRLKLVGRRAKAAALARRRTRIAWIFGARLFDGEVAQAASAMTFDLFLAAIPMLALAGWLLGSLVQQDNAAQVATSALLDLTPSEVRMLVWSHLQQFNTTVAPLVLLGALWMASAAFHTSMSLLEMAVGAAPRPWWHKRVLSMAWVVCMIMVFGAAAWLSVQIAGGPERILEKLAWGAPGPAFARVTHAILLGLTLLTAVLLLGAFYRTAVYRGAPRRVWPGVVATTLTGALLSVAFAYYAQNLAKFAVFYGSLAAVAIALGWLYLLCFTFLAGAELNAVLDHEASLHDGHHQRGSHKSVRESYTTEIDDVQRAAASGSGPTQTPQPSGSSAEA